jgi:serine/threonine protein kinase/tetratricopeptide (TPR) repeat protein
MIGETVCHYRIIEELGSGGMGVVYRAEDTRLKRTVALKFLSPELTRDEHAKHRFLAEAQAASRLDHPNIITIHEIEETKDGQLFLVLSCYEGETVEDRLEKGPMPVDEAVGLAIHVARGMEAAHSKGIVHRDIKPSNVFLTDDGRAKILDFGLAKLAGQTRITRVGSTVGTVAYMSPEQAHGGDVRAPTDIWSLGVVLYEALTGGLPFPGERPEAVLYSVVHEEPEPLGALRHDVPPELEAIVNRCLRKKPDERFASAAELVSALEQLGLGSTSRSSLIRIGSTTRIPVLPARRRGLVVAAAVLVLACVGLFALPQSRSAVWSWFGDAELPELKQLAVLPFRNAGDGSDAAFVDGLRRHLTFKLSQLEQFDHDFRVIPATELDIHGVTTPAAARDVSGATLALTGTVDRSGDDVSVRLDLVDTRSRRSVDDRHWVDDLANVAAFQEDPVVATADMLGLTLQEGGFQVLSAGGTTVPGAFDAYISGLGRLWAAKDDSTDHTADAVVLLEKATTLDPSFALAHADLAQAHWNALVATKDPEESRNAAESARLATELDGRMAAAHVTLGLIEARDGNYTAAVRAFRRALDADPVNPRARRKLAEVSFDSGEFALAEITYKEGLDLRRKHWAPYYELGLFYYERGRNSDALRVLSQAAALAPGNAWPYILIGVIYFDTDRLDEAWGMWEQAAELAPSPAAYSNLGSSYFAETRYADAVRMYEMAIEEDELYYIIWGNLAAAYDVVPDGEERAAECYVRAIALAEEQLKLTPHDAALLASLASYNAELGDNPRAWDYLSRSMELHPEDDEVMFQIGLVHEVLGDRDAALDWIGRAVESGFSREQVESTPGLRDLCTDGRYSRLAHRSDGR